MKKKFIVFILMVAAMAIFFYLQNNWLGVTKLELGFQNLPEEFDGFRIVQLSDLHGKWFGKNQKRLLAVLEKLKPDIIVATGDLADSRHYDEEPALELVRKASEIAPVYFVTGNHEAWSGKFSGMEQRLRAAGAIILRNTSWDIDSGGRKLYISGMDDPVSAGYAEDETGYVKKTLEDILTPIPQNSFKILLSHRPEQFPQYAGYGIDLVFSGHAHGGQFRLPFVGGLVAPDQGFFPKYTSGIYSDKGARMVVSRGLGNSIIPLRIFNRPEVVEVILDRR